MRHLISGGGGGGVQVLLGFCILAVLIVAGDGVQLDLRQWIQGSCVQKQGLDRCV